MIGAFSLLAINWVLMRLLFKMPKVNDALEGTKTVLITQGIVDLEALKKETMTEVELLSVIHKQGFDDFSEVEICVLEPNGSFYVEGMKPSLDDTHMASLKDAIDLLTREVKDMRAQLASR